MLSIYKPFKPFIITQKWGNPNPMYAEHFGNPEFKLHNGIDAYTGRVDWEGGLLTEYPVYCPVENFEVVGVRFTPNGGGNEIILRSIVPVEMFEQTCYAQIIMCHAKKILVKEGHRPKLGELLMIADNTGFSTGLHTHIGLYRTDVYGTKIDTNEATGSFDPSLFMTKDFSVDKATAQTLVISGFRYLAYLLGSK